MTEPARQERARGRAALAAATPPVSSLGPFARVAERVVEWIPQASKLVASAGWPGIAGAGVVGMALLVAGSRWPRLMSAVGGGVVGWLAGGFLAPAFATGKTSASVVTAGFAGTLAVASGLNPQLYAVFVGALPGALLGSQLPFGTPVLGAAGGALALGLLGYVLHRLVVAGTAATAGAVLLVVAALAAAPRVPALAVVTGRPALLYGAAALLAVAGAAFQVGTVRGGGGRSRDGREPLRTPTR